MFRRVVTLLLIPTVLLTQSAGAVHSHGDRQPTDHDARPHIHLPFAILGPRAEAEPPEHHHHSHGSHGHHHHGPGSHRHTHSEPAAPKPVPASEQPDDHDSDAIYLVGHDAVIQQRPASNDGSDLVVAALIAIPATTAAPGERPEPLLLIAAHPPPLPATVPLHVRHLVFLI
jgi:hypothetical protein